MIRHGGHLRAQLFEVLIVAPIRLGDVGLFCGLGELTLPLLATIRDDISERVGLSCSVGDEYVDKMVVKKRINLSRHRSCPS